MKAILIIDMPDEVNVDDYYAAQVLLLNKGEKPFCVYGSGIQYYNLPLRSLPQRRLEWNCGAGAHDWNACLDAIIGEQNET